MKIDIEQIQHVLEHEVFKREVVEGDKAQEACKRLTKLLSKAAKASAKDEESVEPAPAAAPVGASNTASVSSPPVTPATP